MLLARQFIVLIFVLSGATLFGQIPKHLFNGSSGEEYNPKDFSVRSKPINQRIGVYHFGESEGEWDLIVLQYNDTLIVQLWEGTWGKNHYTKKETWLRDCKTFNKVIIEGNKVSFGKYSAQFADCKEGDKWINALMLFWNPIEGRNYGKDSAEVGYHISSLASFYGEKDYGKLSVAVQPESYFSGKSKSELKIMRNTIYAKYGLIFQSGGEMEKYFRKKEWYNPFQKDVSHCVTEIESRNIQTITRLEQL